MKPDPFPADLATRISASFRIAIIGVGDECSPIDRLGLYAAGKLGGGNLNKASVFLAGTVPESITAPVRRFLPDYILILDSADMGARPGTVAVISKDTIRATLVSTHALPLPVVMEYLAQTCSCEVTLLGIQPDLSRPGSGLSKEDIEFLDRNLDALREAMKEPPCS